MALQGTIDSFPVMDVLGLLAASSKTGVLELTGDRGDGSLWLREGVIIAGEVPDHPTRTAADVVFEFLRFESAAFEFTGESAPTAEEFDASVTETIEAAEQMLEDWQRVCEVVPDTRRRVALVAELDSPDVTLSAAEWSLIAASAGGPWVTEVLEQVGLGEFEGCSRLAALIGRGILEVAEAGSDEAARSGNAIKPDIVSSDELEREPDLLHGAEGTHPDALATTFDDGAFSEGALDASSVDGTHGQQGFGESGDLSDAGALDAEVGFFDDDPTPREAAFSDGSTVLPLDASSAGDMDRADAFPDHFPIDDLVGGEGSVSFDTAPGVTSHASSGAAFSSEPVVAQHTDAAGFVGEHPGFASDSVVGGEGVETADGAAYAGPFDDVLPSHGPSASEPTDDVLAQIGRLSPKAAEAIAAALGEGDHG